MEYGVIMRGGGTRKSHAADLQEGADAGACCRIRKFVKPLGIALLLAAGLRRRFEHLSRVKRALS